MRRVTCLLLIALASASCSRKVEPPPPGPSAAALPRVTEPESCRPCHATEVEAFQASAHRLAARRFDDATRPAAARFDADAPVDELARPEMSLRPTPDGGAELLVPDADGASEARPVTHVMGGVRREDFLSPLASSSHVLPVAWSVTRASWINPVAEELGGGIERSAPVAWTTPKRDHARACSRCHPLPAGEAVAGIACATCHGDASAHVAIESKTSDATTWAHDTMRRMVEDPWNGCGRCHATGNVRPRVKGLGDEAHLLDGFLPSTLAGPGGFDVSFRLDGAPRAAHGMDVQSLATSACFTRGGATCTTCHDPHGGPGASLRDPDPDASCRGCHPELSVDASVHAKHAVATSPVPSSRQEPGGAAASRLPGCVDCHAPALLPFGKGDVARDHAISVPNPALEAEAKLPGACAACHPGDSTLELAEATPRSGGNRTRDRRLEAFLDVTGARGAKGTQRAIAGLTALVADETQDPWSRATAANLLAAAGGAAKEAVPALESAWTTASDPVLAIAASSAHARVGGPLEPLKARLDAEKDWRIALAIAGGLSTRGDRRGIEAAESMYIDTKLPDVARADAGSELAVALIQGKSCRRAASVLADVLAKDPTSVPAWLNLGVARACAGDAAGAHDAFAKVLEMQPGHELALRNMQSLAAAAAGGATTP